MKHRSNKDIAKQLKRKKIKAYQKASKSYVTTDAFLKSYEWRKIRMMAIKKYGAKCQCCGATPQTGAVINVDHIKPRKFHPALALSLDNLQVLCHECNHGKGNWDKTDWRINEYSEKPQKTKIQSNDEWLKKNTFVVKLQNI
jgi:5-methylcytosine-specific restriction endonuclease McrA